MPENRSTHPSRGSRTLLLVEDEAIVALAQRQKLEQYGYTVLLAHTGEDAVELATADETVDLVLMDIDLGRGMDGTEAASRILQYREIPIVFLTGHSEKEMVDRVRDITRYGYVLKSSGEFVLLQSIAMAFELYEAHRDLSRSRDHYRSVLDLAGEIVVRHDADGSWASVNRVAREFWGMSEDEALEHDYRELVHPDDLEHTREAVDYMVRTGEPIWGVVNRQRTPRGWRTVEWNSAPILDEQRRLVGFQATGRDITNRVAAETSEAGRLIHAYRQGLDSAEEMMAAVDASGRYLYANNAYQACYGLSEDDLVGRHVREVVGDEAYERVVKEKLAQCLAGRDVAFDYERAFPGRGVRLVRNWYSPIRRAGEVMGVAGVFKDITDEERTHEELARQVARSRCLEAVAHGTLSGSAPDDIIAATVGTLHEHFSDVRVAYSTLDERSLLTVRSSVQPASMPDITGMQGDLSSTPEYLEALRAGRTVLVGDVLNDPRVESVAGALAAGKTRALLDVPLVHDVGVIGLLCFDAPEPQTWSAHEIATLEEVARYLSLALKAATTQEALEASERGYRELAEKLAREHWRLERIIESTNVGTWEWNVQTGETVFNETWARLAGFTLEELEPVSIQTWLDLLHPDDAATSEDALHRHFQGESEYYDVEVRMRTKSGGWVWVEDRGKVISWTDEGEPLWMFGTHTEITRRREAADRVRSLLHEKEMLLTEVHHRVKNNMNTLQALLALQAQEAVTPETGEALEDAKGRVQSMAVLYDTLHTAGRMTNLSLKTYLESLVESVLSLFPAGERVQAVTDIPDLELDTRSLSVIGTMVNELLTNAMKHAFPAGRAGTVSVRATWQRDELELEVADDGVGVPVAEEGSDGSGSGLNLVKLLVEQLDGTFRMESNHGARFLLTLRPQRSS